MAAYRRVFFWGMFISALGALPLGTLNVAAMQVSVSVGLWKAFWFSLGVAVVEMVYVRLSLVGLNWIRNNGRLLRWMDWIAFVVVLLLAFGSYWAAIQPGEHQSLILRAEIPLLLLGIIMSALNPLQIPFWFGWSSFLFSKKILHAQAAFYNWYITGIGIGTLSGLAVFVFGGRFLTDYLDTRQTYINYAIGTVFLATALIQLVKILMNKGLAESAEEKAIELELAELADEKESALAT